MPLTDFAPSSIPSVREGSGRGPVGERGAVPDRMAHRFGRLIADAMAGDNNARHRWRGRTGGATRFERGGGARAPAPSVGIGSHKRFQPSAIPAPWPRNGPSTRHGPSSRRHRDCSRRSRGPRSLALAQRHLRTTSARSLPGRTRFPDRCRHIRGGSILAGVVLTAPNMIVRAGGQIAGRLREKGTLLRVSARSRRRARGPRCA